ncbi:hypothetical protein K6U65_03865 [Vibrio vulnificus]|nr:hypothetical protein [Vibrio vulnificus]MCG6294668.1 hypothetical protein [Vibrio vulnificus]
MYSLSLKPTKRGDEQKLGEVLNRIVSEDPSLRLEHRARSGIVRVTRSQFECLSRR